MTNKLPKNLRSLVYRCFVVAALFGVITAPAWDQPTAMQRRFHRLAELGSPEINESSGVAISHRTPGLFWTHNDSGDGPRIFAFDKSGKALGKCELSGVQPIDWEDMASFERQGKSWLLLADVGDNALDRPTCTLYLCEEPTPNAGRIEPTAIPFRYEDGSHNCEAVAVDPVERRVFLAAKVFTTQCKIYELSLPEKPSGEVLVAHALATVAVPLATAMDISPDRRRAIIVTYSDAFQFERGENETWKQAFSKHPTQLSMPIRRQGESICYGTDSQTLYLTSEKQPSPLWEVLPEAVQQNSTANRNKEEM